MNKLSSSSFIYQGVGKEESVKAKIHHLCEVSKLLQYFKTIALFIKTTAMEKTNLSEFSVNELMLS